MAKYMTKELAEPIFLLSKLQKRWQGAEPLLNF